MDTLYIEQRSVEICETRDLDGAVIANLYIEGQICALTIEHASRRAHMSRLSFKQVATE